MFSIGVVIEITDKYEQREKRQVDCLSLSSCCKVNVELTVLHTTQIILVAVSLGDFPNLIRDRMDKNSIKK